MNSQERKELTEQLEEGMKKEEVIKNLQILTDYVKKEMPKILLKEKQITDIINK